MHSQAEVAVEVRNVVKRYTNDVVVGPISFSVNEGEFFSLLGPSGCGKSTVLRSIAGFESPSAGTILVRGKPIERLAPHKRDVGLVFQNHALFPHLTVGKNVAFGLEQKRVQKAEISQRVKGVLDLVGLGGYEGRLPSQLSGGQQQRVALARSLVLEPHLLLLDEPMSSLDLKLRVQMREELRNLQRRVKKTTIFVTHDQTEALAMSDRIAVLSRGKIEQIGTPVEIYKSPSSSFVAQFIGNSNMFPVAVLERSGDRATIATARGMKLTSHFAGSAMKKDYIALIRPEQIEVSFEPITEPKLNQFTVSVVDAVFLGEDIQLRVAGEHIEPMLIMVKSERKNAALMNAGTLNVHVDPTSITLLDA